MQRSATKCNNNEVQQQRSATTTKCNNNEVRAEALVVLPASHDRLASDLARAHKRTKKTKNEKKTQTTDVYYIFKQYAATKHASAYKPAT